MREATRRPGATGDAEGPQPAGAESEGEAGGDAQASARQQRAHKRRAAANDAEADAFNQRHAAEVAEFNQLTKEACLGEDGKLDAAAVKEWQREHNVAPDGKVGPKTLAAAGGKADEAKDADAAKIEQPKTDKADKKKGPVEDIIEWLGLADIRHAIEQLKALALAPGGADKKQGGGADKQAAAEAPKPEDAGLNSKLSVDAFGNAVEALKPTWSDLDPATRGANLIALANAQLANAGVFPVDGKLDPSVTGRVAGKFHNSTWHILLNKQLFSKSKFGADDAPHMAATVYHEARHAEQYFRMAQLLAGRNATADDIAAQLGVPPAIAAAAMQTKILPDAPEAKFAQKMFDDRAGKGAKHNAQTLEQVEHEMKVVYEPLFAKYEAAKASKDPKAIEEAHAALLKVKQPVMHAWNEYIKLASEADAFKAEHAVDAKLGVAPE